MIQRGITLVETIVVVAITVAVAGAVFSAIRYFYVSKAYVFEAASAVDSARRGLATSLADLREASYGDDGSYPISAAATSSVTFYSDVDSDNSVERVKIWVANKTVYKVITNSGGNPPSYTGQTSATTTIATYLRNATSTPVFTYYDSTGAQLATSSTPLSSIAAVGVNMQIDLNPNRAPNVFTLSGKATLRNLRDE